MCTRTARRAAAGAPPTHLERLRRGPQPLAVDVHFGLAAGNRLDDALEAEGRDEHPVADATRTERFGRRHSGPGSWLRAAAPSALERASPRPPRRPRAHAPSASPDRRSTAAAAPISRVASAEVCRFRACTTRVDLAAPPSRTRSSIRSVSFRRNACLALLAAPRRASACARAAAAASSRCVAHAPRAPRCKPHELLHPPRPADPPAPPRACRGASARALDDGRVRPSRAAISSARLRPGDP